LPKADKSTIRHYSHPHGASAFGRKSSVCVSRLYALRCLPHGSVRLAWMVVAAVSGSA
jgi:hypothetical protein